MSNTVSKYEVNIRGKNYLTVAGRVALAHESGRLLGVEMFSDNFHGSSPYYEGAPSGDEYITVKATVRVLNEKNIELVERLLKAGITKSDGYSSHNTIERLLINEYQGVAKSPREGSPAWQKLPPNAPERSNPTEVCATSALGRALGAAGFGDSESFATADEVSIAQNRQGGYSAPAEPAQPSAGTLANKVKADRPTPTASASNPPSDKQKKFLQTLIKQKLGISKAADFKAEVDKKFGKPIDDLSAKDVSEWIDELTKMATTGDVPF